MKDPFFYESDQTLIGLDVVFFQNYLEEGGQGLILPSP